MNRLVRPIMFCFEPSVVFQFNQINFGAAGAPTLTALNSKGACNIALNSIAFTGTSSASVTVTSVSSFAGLYNGMTVTGTNIPAATTISSMNPGAGTITLSQAATGANTGLSASGGQYTLTLGSQFTPFKRLDAYVKLLGVNHAWDESGLQGGASTGASAPAAPNLFIVGNNVSNGSLASVVFQTGSGVGSAFVANNPANGEILRLALKLCRSSAI